MTTRTQGIRRLFRLAPWRRSAIEAELDEELRFHLEERAAQYRAAGYAPDAAWNEAVRRFGSREAAEQRLEQTARRRETRMRLSDFIDTIASDTRYVVRQLARAPGFTAAVTITLALGIGANATMFAVIDRLFLRAPAGVERPEQLRRFAVTFRHGTDTYTNSAYAYADFRDLRDSLGGGVQFAASAYPQDMALGRGANAEKIRGQLVAGPFFAVLGTKPQLGRLFAPEDVAEPNGRPVAVISDGFWKREFGGRTNVLGKTLALGTSRFTIVGVAPKYFAGTGTAAIDVWLPVAAATGLRFGGTEWLTSRGSFWLYVIGRFPGDSASIVAASGRATNLVRAGRPADSLATAAFVPVLRRYTAKDNPDVKVARLLFWVSTFVLLIACANVVNLMLARSVQRRQEVAVRLALGIDSARLLMLLFSEAAMLALVGGVAALGVVHWGGALMRSRFLSGQTAMPGTLVDARLLAFTAASTIAVMLLIGLAPVAQVKRLELTAALRSKTHGGGRIRSRFRSALVVGQVTLCVVLLVGTALFVSSLRKLNDLRLGMDTRQVLVAQMDLSSVGRANAEVAAMFQEFARRVGALPGVASAAVAMSLPLSSSYATTVVVPGNPNPPRVGDGGPYYNAVDDHYFQALGTRVIRGRGFTADDRATKARVAVVNQSMAQFYWPGKDPIGTCIKVGADTVPCSTIVGIVENARRQSLIEGVSLQYFVPLERSPGSDRSRVLLVRVNGDPDRMVEPVRRAMQSAAADLPYADVRSMQTLLEGDFRPWTLGSTMFSVFGSIGLLLAVVGLYGSLAYDVAQRSRELSVRVALGAGAGDIVRLVTRGGLGLVALGIAAGWAVAAGGARWVNDLLYEVSARDVGIYGAVGGVLIVVAAAATALPAWRATRVDLREAMAAE